MIKFFSSIGVAIACVLGLIAALVAWLLLTTPRPDNIKSCLTTSLFQVRLCPTEPGYIPITGISAAAKNAVLVSEDSAFYEHHGIDWFELQQSAEKNWKKSEFARGGSTITQQLAKNVYLTSEKSILRKVREAIIAIQLEKALNKNEILEKYFNVVEFGPGLYGIGKASKLYFNKSPAGLTPAEGAFLAVLLPNPKVYSGSFRARELSQYMYSQMRIVVDRLHRFKRISDDENAAAVYQINHFYGKLSKYAKEKIEETPVPADDEESFGASVPDHSGASVPDHSGASVPDHSGASVPDHSGASVPDHSGASVPDDETTDDVSPPPAPQDLPND